LNSLAKWCSALDETLLSRIEDAGLNASAPPQQRWLDGWLVRFSPGKAKRARCINAVATGRLPTAAKLRLCEMLYHDAGLPLVVRITPFSLPSGLDGDLAAMGLNPHDDTMVMACSAFPTMRPAALPAGTEWVPLGPADFADAVGSLRGSSAEQRSAHRQRLSLSPVPYRGYAIRRLDDGELLACGQTAIEAELVGLYDVFTRESTRGQGLATLLCQRLLALAAASGARVGYLQVDADNLAARRIYERLGFVEGYRYHYRHAAA
jgi:GNAT superfamily N-acetyltransferase